MCVCVCVCVCAHNRKSRELPDYADQVPFFLCRCSLRFYNHVALVNFGQCNIGALHLYWKF